MADKPISKSDAEKILKQYNDALFRKFRDWGDHPSQTERIDAELKVIEEKILSLMIK